MSEAKGQPSYERSSIGWGSLARLAGKTLLFALLLNVVVAPLRPVDAAAQISLYNSVFPGRLRFPYADDPARSYSVSVTQLDMLFRSHDVSGPPRRANELRVFVIGDSSVWGFRLAPQQTLAARLDGLGLEAEGRPVSFYNLGYPTMSLTKDVMLLERSLAYHPDLILWLVTLESFPAGVQASPLVSFNRATAETMLRGAGIAPERYLPPASDGTWWTDTVVGGRRELAEWLRLQLFGVLWSASGLDFDPEATFAPRSEDLEPDRTFHGFEAGEMAASDLAWDVLEAGMRSAGSVPVWIVNEPMFVSHGANSDIRYNTFYPRWAYDDYHMMWQDRCRVGGWVCLDLWDALPADAFTDSAVHYNPAGAESLAQRLAEAIGAAPSPGSVP